MLQKAFDIVHVPPSASLVLAEHEVNPPLPRAGRWLGPFRHGVWTLDYCGWLGMRVRVGRDGEVAPAAPRAPGTWHLYAPNTVYSERQDRPELRKEDMWLQFILGEPWPLISGRRFTVIADPEQRLAQHVRTIAAAERSGQPGHRVLSEGLLTAILGEILIAALGGGQSTRAGPWRVRSPQSHAESRADRLLSRVDAVVTKRLASPPSLAELADALSVSVSSLSHRFKSETGMTVVERVRWLRVREARRRLALPGATVKSVAYDLGFSSPAYFSTVFTAVSGISPGAYLGGLRAD